jgi:hypothetical protein
MITITHTRDAGTLVDGTSRRDGSNVPLKSAGFRWSRQLGCWYLPHSRDNSAKSWKISAAQTALEAAGFKVTTEIDNATPGRAFADAEAERYERAERRADYHAGRAGACDSEAASRFGAEHQILDMIPPGQPILVGHHSEGRHRRHLARAESHLRAGIAAQERGEYHEQRAETAGRFQARRESVPTTLRRIEKLEAEQRLIQRRLDGSGHALYGQDRPAAGGYRVRLEARAADIAKELEYWREHVKRAEASGAKLWSRADFTKGDFVRFLGTWYEVLRVNAKSVTIPAMINDGPIVRKDGARCTWTDTIPYHKVKGRKSAAEVAALLAEADGTV